MIFCQQRLIYARSAVKTLYRSYGNKLDEVLISGQVFGQKDEVPARHVIFARLVVYSSRRNVGLHAEDRFYSVFSGHIVELLRSVHIAMVGYGQRCHSKLLGFVYKRRDTCGPVEYRVLGMNV